MTDLNEILKDRPKFEDYNKCSFTYIEDLNKFIDKLGALVKVSQPYYDEFESTLVKKAEHSYSDQYGRTSCESLETLTNEEIYKTFFP
jgi:hypothetical protein